jgi:SAM-dependent methyltransferase
MSLAGQGIFYDRKYQAGYMESWPRWKKHRIINLLHGLNFEREGKVLDFGCGKGEFSIVLKRALKNWDVEGTDVSQEAIQIANVATQGYTFFTLTENNLLNKSYDFVFSHHVLEHVEDLNFSVSQLATICKPGGRMLHILPCGDHGSIENAICDWRKDGFDVNRGNRMFFEHPSHERRLKSKELVEAFKPYNVEVETIFFSNIFFGSLEWITASNFKLIQSLTSLKNLRQASFTLPLVLLRMLFIVTYFLRFPFLNEVYYRQRFGRRLKNKLLYCVCLFLFVPSYIINWLVEFMMKVEFYFFKEETRK